MGDKTVLDQAPLIKLVTLKHVLDQVFFMNLFELDIIKCCCQFSKWKLGLLGCLVHLFQDMWIWLQKKD